MRELVPALSNLAMLMKDAVHGAYGTMAHPLVEQNGIDLWRSLVHEFVGVQNVEHSLPVLQT